MMGRYKIGKNNIEKDFLGEYHIEIRDKNILRETTTFLKNYLYSAYREEINPKITNILCDVNVNTKSYECHAISEGLGFPIFLGNIMICSKRESGEYVKPICTTAKEVLIPESYLNEIIMSYELRELADKQKNDNLI